MGGLKILKGGPLSTVQDIGRVGYQQYGVPVSGVMDAYAYRVANFLVGNGEGEAVIEVTMMGFAAEFLEEAVIAITGGNLTPTLNGRPVAMWKVVSVFPGDKLAFHRVKSGCRSYVAFAGGIDVPIIMGSRSTFLRGGFGGYLGRALQKEDIVKIGKTKKTDGELMERSLEEQAMEYPSEITLRVVEGPQEEAFTKEGLNDFYSNKYKMTMDSDRMGFRLEGEKIIHREKAEIISDGIAMGAIQIPGNGQPILMMADRQTTGGYPKIGNVITADLSKLAQAKPGDTLSFRKVSIEEAQEIFVQLEQKFKEIKNSFNNKSTFIEIKPDNLEVMSGNHKILTENHESIISRKCKDESDLEIGTFNRKKEFLKHGQRRYLVRVNDREYTVVVEKRDK